MLKRSAAYFEVWLDAEAIMEKGAGQVHHGQVASYYKCLLELTSLLDFHEQDDFAKFGEKQFAALLK
eukprot:12191345-Heterocapsa_arctica.AAC.1